MLASRTANAIAILKDLASSSGEAVMSRDLVVAYSTVYALCHYFPSQANSELTELLSLFNWVREKERSRFLKQRRIALRKLLDTPLCGSPHQKGDLEMKTKGFLSVVFALSFLSGCAALPTVPAGRVPASEESSSENNLPAVSDLRVKVLAVFELSKSAMADEIRRKRPGFKDSSDEEILSSRNCEPASRALSRHLEENGIRHKKMTTPGHFFVLVSARNEKGDPTEYVVDPTFRQFYGATVAQLLRDKGNPDPTARETTQLLNAAGIPSLLFVEQRNLQRALESFGTLPDWLYFKNDPFMSGIVKPFEYWYVVGLQIVSE